MDRQPLRSHLSGSVPISIAVHLVVVFLVLIIPLTAVDVSLIVPSTRMPEYIRAVSLPPPPPVAVAPAPRVSAARPADVNLAPTSAPTAIRSEEALPVSPSDVPIADVPGGIPVGVGSLSGLGNVGRPMVLPPPEPARPSGPVRVAELPVAPRKTVDVRPIYPELARLAHVEGIVVMEAVLDPTGSVTQLRVIRSVPLLDPAALDAVRQWKYTPSVYGGRPVSVLMTITIRFTLHE
jgi:periplasmic protein TonB